MEWGTYLPTTSERSAIRNGYYAGATPNLLEALSEGMHTMAQPLTVLRATLEIASGNASSISHYQHAIDNSLSEVARVAEVMGFLQELLRIACDTTERSLVDLQAVVATVHEDLKCVLDTAGVSLQVNVADPLPKVVGSVSGLRQCLFYLMQHALQNCRRGDTIHVEGGTTGGEVEIVIHEIGPDGEAVAPWQDRQRRLGGVVPSLALAEAWAKGHGGQLQWRAEPFAAGITLPFDKQFNVGREHPSSSC